MIKINGESIAIETIKLTELLEQRGYRQGRIAVEINEEIIPKALYNETIVRSGDTVEIVSFVGGG